MRGMMQKRFLFVWKALFHRLAMPLRGGRPEDPDFGRMRMAKARLRIRPGGDALRDFGTMTLAIVLSATGVYFFKFPNHFSTGGVTGMAVVLARVMPGLTVTALSNILNLSLLAAGLLLIGRDFGVKTIYCTLLLSALLSLFERCVPLSSPLTDQPLMELIAAMLLSAAGAGLLFNVGASSGGTDVIAMVLKKHAHLYNISTALLISDFLAAIATFFVFDIKTGIFSLFGLMIRGALLQGVMNALRQRKYFHIITADQNEIAQFIIRKLGRSATIFEGQGAYSGETRTLIVTAVSTRQAAMLKSFVKSHSPRSFVLITNTDDIMGNGFRNAL